MAETIDLGFELPWSVRELDRRLRDGDPGQGWRGDPRLSLTMGIICTQKGGYQQDPDGVTRFHRKGDKVGWCWQVMRHNEDGTDTPILQRKGTDINLIIPKLIEMDPRTPGHTPVMDMVEKADAALHRAREQAIADAHGEHMDHLWRLVDEHQNGRHTTRQVGGMDERPDRNLAK